MAELKPKSFRIDDETADKFKEISNKIGGNQQDTLAKLIEAFEFQAGKAVLTEKKSDIEQFEKYVNAITRMYMGSLEDNQNVTEIVRTEFDALLKSKDSTIKDLQDKASDQDKEKNTAVQSMAYFKTENDRLNQYIKSLEEEYQEKTDDLEEMLKDKDSLNKALASSNKELKTKLENINQEHKQALESLKELKDLKDKVQELKTQNEKQNFETQKAIFKLRESHNEELSSLKEKHLAEINQYQEKYKLLLDQLSEKNKKTTATRKPAAKKEQEVQNKELN